MRFDFSLFSLVVVAIVVLLQVQDVHPAELCPKENCLAPEMCEERVKSTSVKCKKSGTVCCSIVKKEFRSVCRHWGGECMSRCAERLTQKSKDCSGDQKCCVLV